MNSDYTIELVSLALDAALMRQTAIANNIANINASQYNSIEVDFEQQFKTADSNFSAIFSKPVYQQASSTLSVDEQMTLNLKNMTHYRALIKGLNQKFAIMKLALQGNNS